jgi:hypothetical protein
MLRMKPILGISLLLSPPEGVAQNCILLYRRFVICSAPKSLHSGQSNDWENAILRYSPAGATQARERLRSFSNDRQAASSSVKSEQSAVHFVFPRLDSRDSLR